MKPEFNKSFTYTQKLNICVYKCICLREYVCLFCILTYVIIDYFFFPFGKYKGNYQPVYRVFLQSTDN